MIDVWNWQLIFALHSAIMTMKENLRFWVCNVIALLAPALGDLNLETHTKEM